MAFAEWQITSGYSTEDSRGLDAWLPPGWAVAENAESKVFYHNQTTGEATWEHPGQVLGVLIASGLRLALQSS